MIRVYENYTREISLLPREHKSFRQTSQAVLYLQTHSVSVSFGEPWDFAASRKAGRATAERRSREATSSQNLKNFSWWTRGELNPGLVHAMDACYRYTTGPKNATKTLRLIAAFNRFDEAV